MPQNRHMTGQSIALIAVFAAFIAASTLVPGVELLGGVPITLQTFAIVLAGLVLGAWRAFASVVLYLAMGLMGLPVFANHTSGLAILTGPTGGYLVGFAAAALVVGGAAQLLARTGRLASRASSTLWLIIAGLISIPVVYAVGAPWLAVRTGMPLLPGEGCSGIFDKECVSALTAGVIPFLPGDLLKVVFAGIVAATIHRAYPGLLGAARTAVRVAGTPEAQEERATA
ncbi:biotin transporter BioY [Demequina sp. SYSU T00068]|uniref:biotin transporter BioY n=1 Tax=Demequina lignilytica TaxID=3051663 RepID=UPI0026022EF5|nr:biotin transporter BioY [Demequina sp. SYSU T00068]MDN4491282.1 biotin transporter BioY [Demequina sp. SYSU T00068]